LPALSDGKMSPDMNVCRLAFVGVIFQLSGISPIRAQFSADSLLYKESISSLHRIYLSEIGDNAQIYHGSEYIRYGLKANGFPYYESDSMLTGSVNYQGNIYTDMNLFYNLVTDEIIIHDYQHNAFITLPHGKVGFFTIGSHEFIELVNKQSVGLRVDGFYEQLFSGEPGLFVRREKRLDVGSGSEETKYIQYNTYWLRKNNRYFMVESKTSLLDLLKDQEDLLKKYIRTNKLKFRIKKDLESSLVLTTMYYSQLKH
jgi:hypothetical protein